MAVDAARAKSLFLAASELADPAARAAYLDRECGGNAELRERVEALLRADADEPSRPGPTQDYTVAEPEPGAVIAGRYTLQEKLGEGGMGEVWVAKQTEPVKRKVALKLIKAGMDSKAVLQRFEAERQALALMDHPHIAKVLDGGLTADRHPYFVMELVNGLPLNKFCDEAKLTPRERLELFVPICQAVQHAHQKGIIHRDLKPGNILVTLIDGRPVPKVIDFGVAKATAGKLTDESLSTHFGAVVGTLEYMAPEQAGYSGEDIDTRADIYSLGVILYELLTGLRPIDSKRLKKAALTEMIRIIKEEEPSKPSTRLSTDESLPSLASLRQTEPKKLMAMLRGELDCVVMKCLEKQRDRRYETANGLARDIQRYLADEVVEARPPSAGYRLKKFVKRHKGQVIAAGLVLFALLGGITGTAWGLVEARLSAEAERLAKLDALEKEQLAVAAADKERTARLEEERQRRFAEAISRFVQDDFLALTSVEGQERFAGAEKHDLSKDTTLHQLLDRAAEKLRARQDLDPRIEAELCWIVGVNYRGAGEAAKGVPFLERAVALRKQVLGVDHEKTLNAHNSLAVCYHAAGKLDLALPLFEETLKLMKVKLGPDHPDTLHSMNNLAYGYQAAGKRDRALPLYEETLKLRKTKLGPDHPDTLNSMNNLATSYQAAGKLHLALPLLEETFKLTKATRGPNHPSTLSGMTNLASGYHDAGKLDLALPLLEEALKLKQARLGPDHPDTLLSMNNLAMGYRSGGRLDLALPLYEETLKLKKAKLGPDHPDTLLSMNNLAMGYRAAGKPDLALPLLEETLKVRKAKLGPDHPNTLNIMGNLAKAYLDLKQAEKATPLFEDFVAGQRKLTGADTTRFASLLAQIILELLNARQFPQAEKLLRECLAIRERKEPEAWTTFYTKSLLGGALLGQKKYADAEPLLLKGYEGMKARGKTIPKTGGAELRIPEALDRLIELYTATNKPDEAKKWQAERAKYPQGKTKTTEEK
jgi:hypothetical protein